MHIDEKGEQLTQEQVIERLTGGQLSMFGAESPFHCSIFSPSGAIGV